MGKQRSEALPHCSNAEATTSARRPCCHLLRSCFIPTAAAASTGRSTARASFVVVGLVVIGLTLPPLVFR
jgi:hypothetical protein